MAKLFLLRHFKSQWNLENRFTGWVDVPLAKEETPDLSLPSIDKIYSSTLIRNMQTVLKVVKDPIFIHLDKGRMKDWANFTGNGNPVYISENLNERYYGELQGLNKKETMEKYGEDKVRLWRRSFDTKPPKGESLKDTFKRTIPFYKKYVEKDLKAGKNVLIVASHNSLRSIAKYVENISDEDIINFEIPYGGLLGYEINGKVIRKIAN